MATIIREAIGIFFDAKHLEAAIRDLRASGFKHDELGLLAGEISVVKSLGELYTKTNTHTDTSLAPETAFVKKESLGDTFRSLAGALVFTGATTAMGIAVASTGIFSGAVLASATGAAGVLTIGALIGMLIHQSDAEYLEEQVDEGHLLLFVRVRNPEEEANAIRILSRHAGYDARVHEVKLK